MEKRNFRRSLEDFFRKDGPEEEYSDLVLDDELAKFSKIIIENLDKVPSLFRYSPADFWNIRGFETGRLRLTPIGKLNDITEGIPFDKDAKLLSYDEHLKALGNAVYIKSFSEIHNSILMWSHYADKHAGFCIKYDLSIAPNKNSASNTESSYEVLKHLYPVLYMGSRCISGNIKQMANNVATLERDLSLGEWSDDYSYLRDCLAQYLIKGEEWQYEKEWRVVVPLIYMAEDGIFQNECIPFDYITAIYLGARINPEVKESILEIVKRKETSNTRIEVYQMSLSPKEFKLIEKKVYPA